MYVCKYVICVPPDPTTQTFIYTYVCMYVHMGTQILWIYKENHDKLREAGNMSALVNKLLSEHFARPGTGKPSKWANSEKIIEEVKQKMADSERLQLLEDFLANWTKEQQEEYKKGVKEGKWKSSTEYAKHVLKIK